MSDPMNEGDQSPLAGIRILGYSTGKGKSSMPPEYLAAEKMLPEYQHALQDGLGDEADEFDVLCFPQLLGHQNVGVAFQVKAQRVYLMFTDADRPEPKFVPGWLLDAAKELTMLTRTLVVPDQTTAATSCWSGIKQGPIVSYRFLLRDRPSRLSFG